VLHKIRSGASVLTAPLQTAGSFIAAPLRGMGSSFDNMSLSTDDISAMRAENERLRSDNIRLQEYELENEKLSALLDISDAYHLQSVGARVISQGTDSWDRSITINKGTNDGLHAGLPVISANGLIGQIEASGPTSSVVRLIADERSGLAVFIQSTRAEGILEGSPDGTLYLRYIAMNVDVSPGETLITSGAGGVYPKGIPVGTVLSVDFKPSDVYKTIVVQQLSRAQSFEEVLVITGSEGSAQ